MTMTAGMPRRLRRQRHALRVVAGRGADDAALRDRVRQVRDLVVGAAQLEREHRLQVLALQQHRVAEARATGAAPVRAAIRSRRLDARMLDAMPVVDFCHVQPVPMQQALSHTAQAAAKLCNCGAYSGRVRD